MLSKHASVVIKVHSEILKSKLRCQEDGFRCSGRLLWTRTGSKALDCTSREGRGGKRGAEGIQVGEAACKGPGRVWPGTWSTPKGFPVPRGSRGGGSPTPRRPFSAGTTQPSITLRLRGKWWPSSPADRPASDVPAELSVAVAEAGPPLQSLLTGGDWFVGWPGKGADPLPEKQVFS